MAVLTPLTLARTGINPVPSAAADVLGDSVSNPDGHVVVFVLNGSGSTITVTLHINAPGPDGATFTNPTVSVPASGTRMIGPFPTGLYNDVNGRVSITYSAVTSVSVLAVRTSL